MTWQLTSNVDQFFDRAGSFLGEHAVQNTVLLSIADTVRASLRANGPANPFAAPAKPADDSPVRPGPAGAAPLFGWWQPDDGTGAIGGAFVHTPPRPVALSPVPAQAAADLAVRLAGVRHPVSEVTGEQAAAQAFATSWLAAAGPGLSQRVASRQRLFRL